MITYGILERFEAVLAGAIMINMLLIHIKHRGDCTFLDIYVWKGKGKGKVKKLTRGQVIVDAICYFLMVIVMVYIFTGVLPELFDIKGEIVKGVVCSTEEPARTHWMNVGTIVIRDEAGGRRTIKHVYYDSDDIVGQTVEVIKLPGNIGDSLVIKCNGEYTDFYKNHYWTPTDIKRITRKFLLIYIPISIGYSIWLIRRSRNSFQKEKEKIIFLNYSRIRRSYYLWITSSILYKLGLVFALFEIANKGIVSLWLSIFYFLYKLEYYIFVMSRYYYLTLEHEEVVIKCRWKPSETYSVRSCMVGSTRSRHYLKILLPNGKRGIIDKNNATALKLAQKS